MAITTATIQMRRGLMADFNPSRLFPGEWAVSIDTDTQRQVVWMCFSPGVVKRMGTLEDFEDQIREVTESIKQEYIKALETIKQEVLTAKKSVDASFSYISAFEIELKNVLLPKMEGFAKEAERWAIGINTIPESVTDNSKYYAEQASLSKNAANVSENNAKISEIGAKQSEQNTALSEQNAKISETAAKQSEQNAALSEQNAKASEMASKQSEDNAMLSENHAKNSEDMAKQSEERAAQSEIDAQLHEEKARQEADRASQYSDVIVPTFHIDWNTMELIQENIGKGIEFTLTKNKELFFEFVDIGGVV